MRRRFEGLIFDMGDILYDASRWRRWLTGELRARGLGIDYRSLVETWEALLVDVYRGKAEYWDRFERLLLEVGLPITLHEEVKESARAMASAVQIGRDAMDGVPDTLAELHDGGVRLAVLSDNESGADGIRQVLSQLGIEPYFDSVISSADIGTVKPEAEAYTAAVESLGLSIERCAFVGHDYEELDGARQCGLFAIAYNDDPPVEADARISHFSELVGIAFAE